MKTPVFYFVFLALLSSFFTSPAVAHQPSSPADSAHFQLFDYEQWERERAIRPAAKRTDLNVGTPRTVRLFYFLPNDRPYRAEVVEAMKTGIVELQTFFADQMEAHGHGRKTFQFEADDQGKPIVHRVDGDYADSHYSRGVTEGEIARAFDNSKNTILIVMDNGSLSGRGGRGASVAKGNGYGIIYENWRWPYAAHELGHAFGLHHDFHDEDAGGAEQAAYTSKDIMSYGKPPRAQAELSACAAEALSVDPFFNSSISFETKPAPAIELISPPTYPAGAESVVIRLRVTDDEGLHQVILGVKPPEILFWAAPPK